VHEVPGHVQADTPENRGNQPASPAGCKNTAYLTSTTSMLPRSAANFISWGEIIFTCRAHHKGMNTSGTLAASQPATKILTYTRHVLLLQVQSGQTGVPCCWCGCSAQTNASRMHTLVALQTSAGVHPPQNLGDSVS
jgi:hypothetical protein